MSAQLLKREKVREKRKKKKRKKDAVTVLIFTEMISVDTVQYHYFLKVH